MSELRLLTYNLHGLRDDADEASAVIRRCEPDVVCIQEAPRFLRWRSKRAAVARKSGLVVATANRTGGLMLMTSLRAQVVRTGFSLLPKSPRLHQRSVCWASLSVGGSLWTIASVHFSLSAEERLSHLASLWAALPPFDETPLVLAGDINEEPGGPVWQQLTGRLTDAWAANGSGDGNTYSAGQPHKRIDGIFASPGVEVVSCHAVADDPGVAVASDHLPVLAVLKSDGSSTQTLPTP